MRLQRGHVGAAHRGSIGPKRGREMQALTHLGESLSSRIRYVAKSPPPHTPAHDHTHSYTLVHTYLCMHILLIHATPFKSHFKSNYSSQEAADAGSGVPHLHHALISRGGGGVGSVKPRGWPSPEVPLPPLTCLTIGTPSQEGTQLGLVFLSPFLFCTCFLSLLCDVPPYSFYL